MTVKLDLKEKGVRKFYSSVVKGFDDNEMVIEHFISTEDEDRSLDIVRADGMMLDGVPAVLKQHGFDPDTGREPVAKPIEISVGEHKGKKGIVAKTKYYNGSHLMPPDNTGQRLYEKARDGFMDKWSIGFDIEEARPKKGGGRDIVKWWLYEYSQVGVPDNINTGQLKQHEGIEIDKDNNALIKFAVEKEKYNCECIKCGHKIKSDDHCSDIKCPECGGEMRREERPGPGKDAAGNNKKEYCELSDVIVKLFNLHKKEKGYVFPFMADGEIIELEWDGEKGFYLDKNNVDKVKSCFVEIENKNKTMFSKTISEAIVGAIPANAIQTITFALLDSIFFVDIPENEKRAKALLKEFSDLVLPYIMQYSNEVLNLDPQAKDKRIDNAKSLLNKFKELLKSEPGDPASDIETDSSGFNNTPPDKKTILKLNKPKKNNRQNSILRLKKKEPEKNKTKTITLPKGIDLQKLISNTVSDSFRKDVLGKVD